MALSISCAHYLADAMPEYGGTLVFVVTGMPNNLKGEPTASSSQCPTGEHADVPGGWRCIIPRSTIRHRKIEHAIAACDECVTNGHVDEDGISTCTCAQGGCCQTALLRILLEHAGLPLGLAVHSDPAMVEGLTPAVSAA